ncbi:SpoIIE family protein phosphatase [Actinocorallia herbida]|uniref:SpoIIE family protein phosphatase n=1 Tax=Actinocorallia herbida TaxID=58109 RepID=UPI0011CEB5E5|nr:SpoIIE family protein phosphatase [Actinocorallia herbida]
MERRRASNGAGTGGTRCEVIHSPFGVRAAAVRAVGPDRGALLHEVLRGFRELAMHETSVAGIAFRIDGFLADREEEYATAVLVEFGKHGLDAEVTCCGHAPPVVVRDAGGADPYALPAALPLGLQALDDDGWYTTTWVPLSSGDGLLLHTGGVRAAQRPFPYLTRIPRLANGDPAVFVERLAGELAGHSEDDLELLLLLPETPVSQVRRPQPRVPTLGPGWSDFSAF